MYVGLNFKFLKYIFFFFQSNISLPKAKFAQVFFFINRFFSLSKWEIEKTKLTIVLSVLKVDKD